MILQDKFGRIHDYMRISITDRCNLRCVYCMGEEGIKLLDHKEILSYEEIIRFVKFLAPWGLKKIRITGGEPLVRKDVDKLLGGLNNISGIEDVSLTTNGELLAPLIDKLMENGLKRINISIDSLKPKTYRKITRIGDLNKVKEGLRLALEKGLDPVKINVVLMKGINDNEILDFIKLTLDNPIHVRFIEYMPLDCHDSEWSQRYLPLSIVKEKIRSLGFNIFPKEDLLGNGTAETLYISGSKGTIGLIHPVSEHFCSKCNRLRLTADGKLKPCLYWKEEINIRNFLNEPQKLAIIIKEIVNHKREKHLMTSEGNFLEERKIVRSMAQIGG